MCEQGKHQLHSTSGSVIQNHLKELLQIQVLGSKQARQFVFLRGARRALGKIVYVYRKLLCITEVWCAMYICSCTNITSIETVTSDDAISECA